ncbi:MAG: hypothetical protein IH872_03355 [Chloroflexi bacterium]|nr:hypothetical protein [Chloroflexota bacterium]
MENKLYFFSVFFGESQRMLNLQWDESLALVMLVTKEVYREINQRVAQIASGQDRIVGLLETFPDEFARAGDRLASIYEAKKPDETELLAVLGKLSTLSYVTTGNGKYLALKGDIKI